MTIGIFRSKRTTNGRTKCRISLTRRYRILFASGGEPFANLPFNAPNMAQCKNASVLDCRASAIGVTAYINYSPDPLNNFSFRPEYYNDEQGQRTGVKTQYVEFTFGWQH